MFPFYRQGRRPAVTGEPSTWDESTNRRESDASQRRLRDRPVKPDIGVTFPPVCNSFG